MLSALQRHSALSILDCSQWRDLSLGKLPASLPMSEICQQALLRNIFIAEGTPFSQDNRATQLSA